ncbi:MAG: glycogen/starch synthase, partial [Nitrospirae bacterium]|nr:glycogen/starch synthase [Nitrospirota bacterium]
MVSPEAVPFAKTGGLADVAGALPRELARLGHSVRLIIPRYSSIDGTAYGLKPWMRLAVPTASGRIHASVEKGQLVDPEVPEDRRVSVLAIRHDPYFARKGLYQEAGADYPDNLERFAFFSRAVVELLTGRHQAPGWTPDILHAHEWQTALCIVYMRTLYAKRPGLKGIRTLFTLHNLGYQGLFPGSSFPKTGLGRGLFTPKRLEFYGSVNLLKGGLLFADFLSTVSPTYSQEIQTAECGFGLEGILRERQGQLVGITNGVDIEAWNPAADRYLPSRYSASDLSGKRGCKAALQREMHLPVRDVPLLVAVSRLTGQKGLDLLAEILPELMALDLQVVLLGTGDPPLEERFRSFHARYPAKIGLRIGFDDGLAHRIEAGGDLFLMPSRYEPCGLNQLYSLRYGTVPVVRRTG